MKSGRTAVQRSRRLVVAGLRRALPGGLAFLALSALLVGGIWVVNVKADPPMHLCASPGVCNQSTACTRICRGPAPDYEEMTCGDYGVCASGGAPACATTCTTSTPCNTACTDGDGQATTCLAWGPCDDGQPPPTPTPTPTPEPECNSSNCATQCCTAGCANKPRFVASHTTAMSCQCITFTADTSLLSGTAPLWDLGDGQHESGTPLKHAYYVSQGHTQTFQVFFDSNDAVCNSPQRSDPVTITVWGPRRLNPDPTPSPGGDGGGCPPCTN